MSAPLALSDVSKAWGPVVALDGVSLDVRAGELVTVLGPSGSGKSTLLRIIAGLEQPDAGAVRIDDQDVTRREPADRGVAMVFQSYALFPHLDAHENIGFGLRARGTARTEIAARVAETAGLLGLDTLLDRRPAQLSGGEQQRVALGRALVGRPQVLLLDEPLSNLDAQLRVRTRAQIRRVHAETGVTLIYVTHDQAEALALGDRLVVLRDGRVQQAGLPAEVYDRPANAFVAGFLGTPPMTLLAAVVQDGELRAGPVRLPVPPGAGAGAGLRAGDAVLAGVRPEHLSVGTHDEAPACSFPAQLELAETIGHERLWHVRAGPHTLTVRPSAAAAAGGSELRLWVDPADVRLFALDDQRQAR